eukprot:1139485-Pelagomonas_calceolata.AAC.8
MAPQKGNKQRMLHAVQSLGPFFFQLDSQSSHVSPAKYWKGGVVCGSPSELPADLAKVDPEILKGAPKQGTALTHAMSKHTSSHSMSRGHEGLLSCGHDHTVLKHASSHTFAEWPYAWPQRVDLYSSSYTTLLKIGTGVLIIGTFVVTLCLLFNIAAGRLGRTDHLYFRRHPGPGHPGLPVPCVTWGAAHHHHW